MNQSLPALPRLLQALGLLLLLSACQNQDIEPPYPITFNALKNIRLVPTPLTRPAAVTVTSSAASASALWTTTSADLAQLSSSGQLTITLNRAAIAIDNALVGNRLNASQLVTSFTPAVLDNLASQRTLGGDLQRSVADVLANPGIQAYLPTFTYGRVNGREIGLTYQTPTPTGPTVPVVQALVALPVRYAGPAGPYKAANDLYDVQLLDMQAVRARQIDAINAAYSTENTAIESALTTGQNNSIAAYAALILAARQRVTGSLTSLDVARPRIGESIYNSLAALVLVQYVGQIQLYDRLQLADKNGQLAAADARRLASQNARDADLSRINTDFNAALLQARDQLEIIVDLQGGGR